jgi:hypothetical protein
VGRGEKAAISGSAKCWKSGVDDENRTRDNWSHNAAPSTDSAQLAHLGARRNGPKLAGVRREVGTAPNAAAEAVGVPASNSTANPKPEGSACAPSTASSEVATRKGSAHCFPAVAPAADQKDTDPSVTPGRTYPGTSDARHLPGHSSARARAFRAQAWLHFARGAA